MKPFHMTQINHCNVIKLNIVIRNDSAELGSLQPSKTQALHSFTMYNQPWIFMAYYKLYGKTSLKVPKIPKFWSGIASTAALTSAASCSGEKSSGRPKGDSPCPGEWNFMDLVGQGIKDLAKPQIHQISNGWIIE